MVKQNNQSKQKKQTKQVRTKVDNTSKQVNYQRKDNSTKYLCLFIVIVAFAFAFALLIDKQKNGSYMNDLSEGGFSVKPEVGKIIVARDMDAIYPKYFVVYTEEDSYSIYVYNYYETTSQYELEYNRLIDQIVDYNAKDKMIRYIYDRGYGTYNEVLNNLSMMVNCKNLRIY